MLIRPVTDADNDALWRILAPVIRAGETYPLPRDMNEADAIAYWRAPSHDVFVAEENNDVLGTYYLRANNRGGGAHVCNCGFMTAMHATGRGVARALCVHAFDAARARNFSAMQFNFVIATNDRAVKLWRSLGFATVGHLPAVFDHPRFGPVDALVMIRSLRVDAVSLPEDSAATATAARPKPSALF